MPFQTQVYVQPTMAIAGDFASTNPRFVVDAGPGGLVAGTNLFVGRFAWTTPPLDPNGTAQIANCNGSGSVTGFVHREQQGIFTAYLQEVSMQIAQGFPITLFSGGDFWVVNSGSGEATVGMKAYANFSNGLVTFAATGSPTQNATSTASTIAAATASVTASISGNIMTVTAVGSGTLYPGSLLTSGAASGTTLGQQISGTTGGIGTYYVSIPEQTVASTTIGTSYGLLTIGGTVTGSYGIGSVITGGGTATGTIITALGTGTGGAGTYIVNLTQTVNSAALDANGNVETKWIAMSAAAAGELIKISSHPLG